MNDLYKELDINPADTRTVIDKKLSYQQAKWELATTSHDDDQRILAKYKLNLVEEARHKLLDTINKMEYDQQLDIVHKANRTKMKTKIKLVTENKEDKISNEPDTEFIDQIINTTLNIDDTSKQRAYRLQIQHHIENNNYDVALNEAKKYINDFPKLTDAWHQLAKVYAATQTYNVAESCYKHIIELEPDNFEHYVNLGRIYLLQGQLDEALLLSEKAEELNFVHGIALKGDIYFLRQDYHKAIKIYQHLANFYEPGFFNIRLANCYMHMALNNFSNKNGYYQSKSKASLKSAQRATDTARQYLKGIPNHLLDALDDLIKYETTYTINKKRWPIPAGVAASVFAAMLAEGQYSIAQMLFYSLFWGGIFATSLFNKRINIKNRSVDECLYLPMIEHYQFITLS